LGTRTIPLRIDLRILPDSDPAQILVECRDASKEKEAEYMLESYSKMSEKHRKELEKEKERTERLLLNIMPKTVYEELKDFGTTTPQRFECASILMLDFVEFTNMAISQDPSALLSELNDIFSAFDRIVEMFGSDRLRTMGDAYMAVSGLPEPTPDHASNIAKVALRMRRYLDKRNAAHPQQWRCRIGINAGPVIGSLVGIQKYVYDVFGPGINLASRMESMSEPMRITLCEDTYEMLKDDFVFSERGEHEIKGFGTKKLFFLESERR
jgi:class 3 adenylate cyclase